MGYAAAAYLLVIGTLVAYGIWLRAQRRDLLRREREGAHAPGDGGPRL